MSSYYATGPRVRPYAPFDRYYQWDWRTQPHPGELEYLALRK